MDLPENASELRMDMYDASHLSAQEIQIIEQ